jgi:hypothetical protein
VQAVAEAEQLEQFGGALPAGPGMGCSLTGAPGQRPETSSAWPVMSPSAAASAIGVLAVPPDTAAGVAGVAGRAPGTNPSGSDHRA